MAKEKTKRTGVKGVNSAEAATSGDSHVAAAKGVAGKSWAVKSEGIATMRKKDRGDMMDNNKVHESHVHYGGGVPVVATRVSSLKNNFWGGDVHVVPAADKITLIKNGISKEELEAVKEESNLDYDTLSNILSVSKAKLHSKKGADKFDQNTSERIMLLADLVAYGQSVFEDKDSFNEWLKASNTALGGKAPIELMDTIYGIDEVKKEIGRIEYGVF